MNNNSYFEPDYNLLNRKARRLAANGNNSQPGSLFERMLFRNNKVEPITNDPELFKRLSAAISDLEEKINWDQNLFEASYVVFDTETTGLHPFKGDEIISVGAVIVENARIINEPSFYKLVNPKRPVSASSQRITGITDEMLKNEPEIGSVLLDFLEFTGPRVMVAHNAPFDLAFINNKLSEAIGRRIVNPVIDTVLLTSALYYSFGDYSLESLSSRFNLSLKGRHNALGDARIAASLFIKLLPELEKKNITTLPELSRLFSDSDLTKGYPLIY